MLTTSKTDWAVHNSSHCVNLCVLCFQMHLAGHQKTFNIFSVRSGGKYLVEVRCKPDHGFWSEWSSTSYIKVPDCKTSTNNHLLYTSQYI